MLAGPAIPRLALLRVGVAEPPGSPRTLVRSYRTVSPLPVRRVAPPSAVCSLLPDPTGHPVLALASTLPFGVPTFLDVRANSGAAATRPAHRHQPCYDGHSEGTSLNETRVGTEPRTAMRVADPGETNMRHAVASSTPSAQATAAFSGDTCVVTTTVPSAAASTRSVHAARTRTPS